MRLLQLLLGRRDEEGDRRESEREGEEEKATGMTGPPPLSRLLRLRSAWGRE